METFQKSKQLRELYSLESVGIVYAILTSTRVAEFKRIITQVV